MKQTIKLTENELKNIINECVKRSLNEWYNGYYEDNYGGWDEFNEGEPKGECTYDITSILDEMYEEGCFGNMSEEEFEEKICDNDKLPYEITINLYWDYDRDEGYYELCDTNIDKSDEMNLRELLPQDVVDELLERVYDNIFTNQSDYE